MKAFVLSLVLLALMLAGIAGNYIYINKVADSMNTMLDELPDMGDEDCIGAAMEIFSYWESHVDTVGLSVEFITVDRVSEQIASLLACAECGDFYGFRVSVALLRDAIGDMRRLEAFSIGNLL